VEEGLKRASFTLAKGVNGGNEKMKRAWNWTDGEGKEKKFENGH